MLYLEEIVFLILHLAVNDIRMLLHLLYLLRTLSFVSNFFACEACLQHVCQTPMRGMNWQHIKLMMRGGR